MSKPFKVGFIGAGGIARTHMKYLKEIEGVEICCAADVSEKTLAVTQEQYKIGRVYSDYKQMLKEENDLDAIDVCTPNGLHAQNAIAALEAGKHVIVEKPMAMNATKAQAMLDAAKKSGKQLIVGFQHRFDPQDETDSRPDRRRLVREDALRSRQALRRRGIPNWGVFGRKELQGGGPMIDIGVHILEMAHYMIGSPRPVTATGNTWTYHGQQAVRSRVSMWPDWDHKTYTVEDLAVGMIRFDNGAMLTIEASFVAHIEKDIWNVHAHGREGRRRSGMPSQIFTDHGGYMMNMTPGVCAEVGVFEYKMKHFVEVCRDGRENEAPGEHGLMVQKMLDGVYASAEQKREVVVE